MKLGFAKIRIFCGIWEAFGEKYVIVAIGNNSHKDVFLLLGILDIRVLFVTLQKIRINVCFLIIKWKLEPSVHTII